MYSPLLRLITFFTITTVILGASIDAAIKNSDVKRTIDLTSHLPKVSSSVKIQNTGSSPVNSYLVAIESKLSDHLSYISALVRSGEEETKLAVKQITVSAKSDVSFYQVDLASPLTSNSEVTILLEAIFSHSLEPFPSEIAQAENQLVRFAGANLYFYSPYETKTQTTTVNCASNSIESYTKSPKPVSQSENTITYGPYENVAALSEVELSVHYQNNSPFLTVTSLERVIELSHWGNIAVEETIDVVHSGAHLKGSFSRYDYQRSQDGAASIKAFKTILPASARDVYYRDEIGNISTSAMRDMDDMVELELRPRFPLFGGWKTHYVMGYNVPSYQYLYQKGDQYALKMRFLDHVYDDQVIDHLTVKIILPEGVKDIDFHVPYDVKRGDNEKHSTYLDTTGRTVLVAHKSNLVEQHIQDFQCEYRFQKFLLLQEPLLVVIAFYLLFLTVIVYVRMDFSITKDEVSESRMRVASLVEQVQAAHDRRSALYQSYDDSVNKYKANKDPSSFAAQRKRVDTDYKALTTQIATLLSKIKPEASDVAEKVTDLQKLDTQMRDQINLSITLAEKLVAGKLSKQQYLDNDATVAAKRKELYQKMDDLLSSF